MSNAPRYLVLERQILIQTVEQAVNVLTRKNGTFDLRNDLNLILQHAPGCITWKNKDSEYMGSNERMLRINKMTSANEIIGKRDENVSWSAGVNPETIREEDAKILAGGTSIVLHHYVINRMEVDMLIKKVPIVDRGENIIGIANYAVNFYNPSIINIICAISQFGIKLTADIAHKINAYIKDNKTSIVLSTREEECLYYLLRGLSAKEIGKPLCLSQRTVEFYINGLKDKLACHKVSALIVKAVEMGYLDNIPLRVLLKKIANNG